MLINIHDSHLEKVGFLDSESPGAPGFFNDVEHHYLAEGASTFTFSVNKKKNGILQDYCQFLNEDAYFSFSENGEDHFYSVGTVDEDNDTTFTVTCYSLNLELRLEQCDPLENTASHNIQWYFDQMGLINNTQITIGINEVSDLSRVIKYDGQESKLARLISLIGNFDAEFEFITKSNNDGTLDKIILNIYKENDGVNFQGVGTNRDDVILTLDTNITGVSRTVDKTQIFNATTITGADGLNWNSSEFSYVNSDGVEEFYKRKNADTAFAPLSLAKYPSQIQSSTGDRWIRKNFTTDYTSANAIWGYAVSQFKKFAYGIVTYKVSVSSLLVNSEVGNGLPLKIGDTVTISDDNFIDSNGVHGLILSARVSEMEISRTDPTKNTLVFSNYIRLQSQISNDLQSQLSNLVDAATPYIGSISTTNGTQFKNGTGSTTLSAHIFKGSATTETIADSYEWSKDGTVVAPTQTITVDASGVADKAVYSFKATVGGKVVASQSVTITNVNDGAKGAQGPQGPQGLKGDPGATGIPGQAGADGKTQYTHIAYANSADGKTDFSTSDSNRTYIGMYVDFNINDSTTPSDYSWTLVKGADGTQGTPGKPGADGKTPYFHTAWSNSADGTDGFTTVYPNLNLLKNTKLQSYVSTSTSTNNSSNIYTLDVVVSDIINKRLTISYDYEITNVDGAWSGYIRPTYGLGGVNKPVSNYDFKGSVKQTITLTNLNQTAYSITTSGLPTGAKVTITNLKLEFGSTSTIWIPSASEVTTADWPSYIGQYTDFTQADSTKPSDYTWSLIRGNDGKDGADGKDGIAGKVVSDTEPTTRFKGLTWKYSGTTDLTASDGTVILSGTEYYWSGTNWILNEINAHNINGNNLTITDGEFVSTTTNGLVTTSTEIKDNHIAISKTDGTVNTRNDIALDSEQGLAQKFTNIDTGFYRTAGINYQGPFTSDSDGNYAQLTPQGTKLSTDVPWTTLAATGGFSGGTIQFSVQNGVAYFSVSGLSVPAMTGNSWYQCAQLPTGSSAIPSVNRVTTAFGNASVWGFYVSKNGGLYFQSKTSVSATASLANALAAFPIG